MSFPVAPSRLVSPQPHPAHPVVAFLLRVSALLPSVFSTRAPLWRGLMLALLLALCGAGRPAGAADSDWASTFNLPGASHTVRAVVQNADAIYIGGDFNIVGTVAANRVARYDKSSQTWSALGSGISGTVTALALDGTDLYVGGNFTTAGGTSASNIAKWRLSGTNDNAWSALGAGTSDGVAALALNGTDLYVGGYFTSVGGISANYVAKWSLSGSTDEAWSALGSGTNTFVNALALNGTDLYVGGYFSMAGGISASHIAKWSLSGTSDADWSPLGSGVNSAPFSLALNGTDLYVGGSFDTAGGTSANYVAKWSLSGSTDVAWSALGSGLSGSVHALAPNGTDLYVGGNFTTPARYIAKWNGSNFTAVGSGNGMNNTVRAIVDGGSVVYVGGNFTAAGGVPANRVACYDKASQTWSALGSGMDSNVFSLALNGTHLYVGGIFSTAGGTLAHRIAKWSLNGTTDAAWSPLGSGISDGVGNSDVVRALALNGTDLYVGGEFITAGSTSASRIAKWSLSGSTDAAWSALGSGVDTTVTALALGGSDLYVGGLFNTAGGTSALRIAKWSLNGTSDAAWSPLGSGVNNQVFALALSGTDLYVGGNFNTAGVTLASCIARWSLNGTDNTAWSALGSGTSSTVTALALNGTDLYVGGDFTTAGGTSNRTRVARWSLGGTTNTAWSALGSGVSGRVHALALDGTHLYAGGQFTTAGLKISNSIGSYALPPNTAPTATVSLNTNSPQTNDTLTATATANDAQGHAVTLTYVWKNGATIVKTTSNTSSLTDTLNLATATYGNKGDVITVTVTPSDPALSGTPVSASATVTNSAPTVKALDLPTRIGSKLLARLDVNDADGDSFTLTPQGSVGLFNAVGSRGFFLYTPPASGAAFNDTFTVDVSDGSDTATANLILRVASYGQSTPFYTAVGASDVQGYGASDYGATFNGTSYNKVAYSPVLAYAPQVASSAKLGTMLPGLALSRRAINGLTLSDALTVGGTDNTIALAAGDGAKAYSIAFGPNDVLYELAPALRANLFNPNRLLTSNQVVSSYLSSWSSNYTSIKTRLQGANPSARFAAITVPDLGPGLTLLFGTDLSDAQKLELSAAITSACQQMSSHIKTTFPASVDIQNNSDLSAPTGADALLVLNPQTDLFVDGFHPNDSGYNKLATRLFRLLDAQFNHAPTNITLSNASVTENAGANATVGTLGATDVDSNDTFTFSLPVDTDDNDLFNIDGTTLRANTTFDYETKTSYLVTVRVVDAAGEGFDKQFTLSITNINEAPSFTKGSDQSATNSLGAKTVVGWATDLNTGDGAGQTLDFIVNLSDADSALFSVQPAISPNGTLTYTPQAGQVGVATVSVQIHDDGGTANGGIDTSAAQTFTITVKEDVRPDVTITAPSNNARLHLSELGVGSIRGTATDNLGVTQVRVMLRRYRGTGFSYWNGTTFTTTNTLVNATLSSNGTNVTWSLDTAIPASELDAGTYFLSALANDEAGNSRYSATHTLTLFGDSTAPGVAITAPTQKQRLRRNALVAGSIQGSASDNVGVTRVRLLLRRFRGSSGTGSYWNGTSFVSAHTTVNATLSGTGTNITWSLQSAIPAAQLDVGTYFLSAIATDAAGNSTYSTTREFILVNDSVAPSVTIAAPTQKQSLHVSELVSGSINGSATDSVGVAQVKIVLRRFRSSGAAYWNGTAFVSGHTSARTTVTGSGTNVIWSLNSAIPAEQLDAGSYFLTAIAYDAAGNTTFSTSREFIVYNDDTTSPTSTLGSSAAGS